jgi:hypothetical protein
MTVEIIMDEKKRVMMEDIGPVLSPDSLEKTGAENPGGSAGNGEVHQRRG